MAVSGLEFGRGSALWRRPLLDSGQGTGEVDLLAYALDHAPGSTR